MEELVKAMKIAFASENIYYVKASSFHWNIEGSNFPQYHALLDTIYTEVYNARDEFAENIRYLGSYALGSNSSYIKYSAIQESNEVPEPQAMLAELLADSEKIISFLKIAFDLAEREHEHGLSNFIAERQTAHGKHAWMLRSTLKAQGI
jgi:starvation-inducible DNA-binding protein